MPVSTSATERLQASPNFVQARGFDGRPYVVQESEPYAQFWLSERERLLLALFGARGGATAAEAEEAYFRLTRAPRSAAERQRVRRAVAGMRAAGVLAGAAQDRSRYGAAIVRDYVAHRPFPRDVAQVLVRRGGVGPSTRVLDLAGGPGDLALALAAHSDHVTLMELSRGFVAAARARARAAGLKLAAVNDSCNRLVQRDDPFDVISVSQALHWLDDVAVCRGVCKLLQPGGSFFVVHSAIELDEPHPLAYLLGHDSILGRKARLAFKDEVAPLQRRLALLFEALDAPEVERIDPAQRRGAAAGQHIAAAGVQLFRQRRPFGPGYARGFLTPRHIAVTGQSEADFWADLDARCAGVEPARFTGTHHWAVLHFQRGAAPLSAEALRAALQAAPVQPIGYEPVPGAAAF